MAVAAWLTSTGLPVFALAPQASPATPTEPLMLQWCGGAWRPAERNEISRNEIEFQDRVGSVDVSIDPKAFPTAGATYAMVLSIVTRAANARDSALSARVSMEARDGGPDIECFSSEAASPSLRMLLPGGFRGRVTVTATEATADNAARSAAAVTLEHVELRRADEPTADDSQPAAGKHPWFVGSLSQGHAIRATLTADRYQQLVSYARCEYLNEAERANGCATKERQMAGSEAIYNWLSQLLGRSPADEYATRTGSLTEPIIAFFGLANVNRSALLDCRTIAAAVRARSSRSASTTARPLPGSVASTAALGQQAPSTGDDKQLDRHCIEYAEPWQTSLQRADYAWAVYLEDELTGFDTAIDIEFKPRATPLDYEEFDPRAPVQSTTIGRMPTRAARTGDVNAATSARRTDVERRTIRIGYRRFRIREAPTALQVAFTRQGPTYGARQYQRVYRKRSSRTVTVAATLFIAAKTLDIEDARKIVEEPPQGPGTPTFGRLNTAIGEALVYTGASFRWPTARARADDQPNWYRRLGWNAIPDITAGFSFRNGRDPYFVGGSWPIWPRLYATAGMGFVLTDVLKPEYRQSQLVPIDSTGFTETQWKRKFLFGISIDLLDSR